MYSTCIFCHGSLGANESVEHFPVGRRLAFDAARGRLWVVCRRCERWNLSPLDERWEAIEECERLFRGTPLRVSTDNIGLARVGDGLELVRIGEPLRPEMAAWRYGDQFGRRRRKHMWWSAAGAAAGIGVIVLGPVTGLVAGSTLGLWNLGGLMHRAYQMRRLRARVIVPGETTPVRVRRKHLAETGVLRDETGWALRVAYEIRVRDGENSRALRWSTVNRSTIVHGDDALRAAASLLPAINETGAKRNEVNEAVRLIADAGDPLALFDRLSKTGRRISPLDDGDVSIIGLPKEMRLALEMATHEDSERRALEGELAHLEQAWRLAEEVAGIADDLFVPDDTRVRLARLKDDSAQSARDG